MVLLNIVNVSTILGTNGFYLLMDGGYYTRIQINLEVEKF